MTDDRAKLPRPPALDGLHRHRAPLIVMALDVDGTAPEAATAAPRPPAPLDEARLAAMSAAVRDEIIGLFLEDVPARLAALRAATACGDVVDLERVAHLLKGEAGAMGALALQAIADRLVRRVRAGRLADLAPLLAELDDAYARVAALLRAYLPA